MPYGVLSYRHLQRRRPVGAGQPRRGGERQRQPGVVPAVQRAQRHHASTTSDGDVQLRLDAGHAEPSDRAASCSTSSPTRSAKNRRHARRRIREHRPVRSEPHLRRAARDRTHVLNVSWNAFLPDGAKGTMDNAVGRGLLNGWQLSGISSLASGIPIRLSFSGDAASNAHRHGLLRHRRRRRPEQHRRQRAGAGLHLRPAARRQRGRREDPRPELHRGAGVRPERRPRAAVQHPDADAREPRPDALQELQHDRRPEAPVPRRLLQHVQPGVRQHQHRRRHQPDARHGLQRHGERHPERHRRHVDNVCDPTRASTTRRRPRTTSARSTSSAATASSSSC